jgi:hypothetical protein
MKNIGNSIVANSCQDWEFSKDGNMRLGNGVSCSNVSIDILISIYGQLCINCSSKEELISNADPFWKERKSFLL